MSSHHDITSSSFSKMPPSHHLWIDADPSGLVWTGLDCDDDLAILVALGLNDTLSIEGLSICGGNAPLDHTWADVHKLLDHAGSSIKPVRGYGWRSTMHVSRLWLRMLHWIAPDMQDSEDAADAIIRASHAIPSLTILTLGPPTNLARALEKDPSLASRLHNVVMMGGELTGSRLDLNFVTDRGAARTVVDANVPVTLVTIQLCAQAIIDKDFVARLERDCCPDAAACSIMPKMKQQVQMMPNLVNKAVATRLPEGSRWRISPNMENGFIPWDIIAVLVISNPELFDEFEYHHVAFPQCEEVEPCDMTMNVMPFLDGLDPSNHSGIVQIPHLLRNETETLDLMYDLICKVPGQGPPTRMMMGFLTQISTCVLGTLILSFLRLRL